MLQEKRKKVIFWSICQLNNWKHIVLDQYYRLLYSEILKDIDAIYITVIGDEDIDWLLKKNKKFILDKKGELKHYERTCLHSLLDWSKENDADVLYMHTKGVSHANNPSVQEWRRMLEYFLIENYQMCLEKLEDVVCCTLCDSGKDDKLVDETHKVHPTGNFWWAKTEYIRTLPLIRPDYDDLSIDNRYWLTERWVLYHYPKVKVVELYPEGRKNYYSLPPNKKEYEQKTRNTN